MKKCRDTLCMSLPMIKTHSLRTVEMAQWLRVGTAPAEGMISSTIHGGVAQLPITSAPDPVCY